LYLSYSYFETQGNKIPAKYPFMNTPCVLQIKIAPHHAIENHYLYPLRIIDKIYYFKNENLTFECRSFAVWVNVVANLKIKTLAALTKDCGENWSRGHLLYFTNKMLDT
jgi:hypothetical protein